VAQATRAPRVAGGGERLAGRREQVVGEGWHAGAVQPPTPRPAVYDTYWHFAAERQRIFYRRLEQDRGPWTEDPILAEFKFCNAFRASDRVSQYLISEVIYSPQAVAMKPEDAFLRVVLFRLFSKESTWEALEAATGGLTRKTFNPTALGDVLERLRRHQSIYTGAFILCAYDAYGHRTKHRNHLALVEEMFRPRRLGAALGHAGSLREVYEALLSWPMIGPFMAYQLAIDLNYTEHLDFSEDEFTMPGPGAMRGLKKVFADFGDYTPAQLIMRMVERQAQEFDRLGLEWEGLFGEPLRAIDCQGLFCETDKYARMRFPELKSNRVRIKARFSPSRKPLPLFYPRKWGINDRIPASTTSSAAAPATPPLEPQHLPLAA